MSEFMDHWLTRSALLLAATLVATAIGFAIARKLRDRVDHDKHQCSELITKFRDLHARGGLSDEEYRSIKTKLAAELQIELSDNNGRG
jgi:uncharacterized membrane protein